MRSASDAPAGRVVRVLPDEPAIDKTFDYLVPESLGDQVRVGTRVRIALSGRRVGGWVVAVDVAPPPGVTPRPLAQVSGHGPPADLIDLAHWAAWRWAGRPASFLRTANPERVVTSLPSPARRPPPAPPGPLDPLLADAFAPAASAHGSAAPAALTPPRTDPGAPAGPGARLDAGGPSSNGSGPPWSPEPTGPGADVRTSSATEEVAGVPIGEGSRPAVGAGTGGGSVSVDGSGAQGTWSVAGAGVGGEVVVAGGLADTWGSGPVGSGAGDVGREGRTVVRMAPGEDVYPVVRAAAGLGSALVICPTVAMARSIGTRLRRDGVGVAFHPRDWAAGAAGATVVGTRAAAWAPVADLAAVVVLDEHDESHAQEQTPTWHARDVVAERARRAGVPCVLVSPCPSLEALAWGHLLAPSRNDERAGWPVVDVVDRRQDDPRTGLFSPRLVDLLRSERRVVCVLNRTGRARLLACAACGELARCEACDAALSQASAEPTLACPRCGTTRPVVCAACGGTRLKLLRQGVSRVREELEALVGEPVDEASSPKESPKEGERRPVTRVVVGTEAVLHQVDRADVVAFLDLDQELLAPRYRAVEEALALVARAARLVGGKAGGGRLMLQTRVPQHEVVQAALHGDPARVAEAEADRRALLRYPPAAALAEVSGPAAEAYIAALRDPSASAAPGGAPAQDEPAMTPDLWSTMPEPDLWSTADPPAEPDLGSVDPAAAEVGPWSARSAGGAGRDVESAGAGANPWSSTEVDRGIPAGSVAAHEGSAGVAGDGWPVAPAGGVEILGPADGRWLVRAPDHRTLCDALAVVPRPPGRLRLAVDPLRI